MTASEFVSRRPDIVAPGIPDLIWQYVQKRDWPGAAKFLGIPAEDRGSSVERFRDFLVDVAGIIKRFLLIRERNLQPGAAVQIHGDGSEHPVVIRSITRAGHLRLEGSNGGHNPIDFKMIVVGPAA